MFVKHIYLALIASLILTLIGFYPGVVNTDGISQYTQALNGHYIDWFPPLMAWIWGLLDHYSPSPENYLFFQLIPFIGFVILATHYFQKNHRILLGIFYILLMPETLSLNGMIFKDMQMAYFLLFGFFLLLYGLKETQKKKQNLEFFFGFILIAYALTTRHNALIAICPLLFAFFFLQSKNKIKAFVYSLIFSFGLLIASFGATHLLAAKKTYPTQSFMIFDLAGIYAFGGDGNQLFPPSLQGNPITFLSNVKKAYTPDGWNSLVFHNGAPIRLVKNEADYQTLVSTWKNGILEYPVPYLKHRLHVFSSFMKWSLEKDYYYTFQIVLTPNPFGWKLDSFYLRKIVQNILIFLDGKIFFVPWIWTTAFLGLGTYFLIYLKKTNFILTDNAIIGWALLTSGLLYLLMQIPFLPAADYRYFHWTLLSSCLGVSILWGEKKRP